MRAADSVSDFLRDPIGKWVLAAPTVLVFCAHPELCGAVVWGRPPVESAHAMLEAFHYRHPKMSERFDVVLDGSGIDVLDPDTLACVVGWLRERREELARRVRMQVGVVSDSFVSITLTGILPILGETHPFRLSRDRTEALMSLGEDNGPVAATLDEAVVAARGESYDLRRLRELLRADPARATIDGSARSLALSPRTLQRILENAGTSYREELRAARLAVALPMLIHGDAKIAVIAGRVGLSERALTELVRRDKGTTPGALREKK